MSKVHVMLSRTDKWGSYETEVTVHFGSRLLEKGLPAQTRGDPSQCWPAEPNEWDHQFERATLGTAEPRLSADEARSVMRWFESGEGQEAADRVANEEERSP